MARLVHRSDRAVIASAEAFLGRHGVLLERWPIDSEVCPAVACDCLSRDEQRRILERYGDRLAELKRRRGYATEDVVALCAGTPDLDTLLDRFRREHHHADDEVRFVLDGGGVFRLWLGTHQVDLELQAGDMVVIPAFTRHAFDLTERRQIVCLRVFKDPQGWIPIYEPRERSEASAESVRLPAARADAAG